MKRLHCCRPLEVFVVAFFFLEVSDRSLRFLLSTPSWIALVPPFLSPTPIASLKNISLRYYIYNDSHITQDKPSRVAPLLARRYGRDVEYEQAILHALQTHPLRTDEPDKADLFIVPTPIGKILTSHGLSYEEAFISLTSHPLFNNGNKHVLISALHVTFSYSKKHVVRPLSRWYGRLANVTVATGQDHIASQRAYARGELAGNEYESEFKAMRPVVHHMFSIGLGEGSTDFPIHEATVEKFLKSKYFIFYRTRTSGSLFNSTRFRHAPVNTSLSGLPLSNIGFDISREEWLESFPSSKFCLVIRGDSPHTHALIRSVRAGCIPVVISDVYPIYAPIFKSTLNMHDYCIFIDEEKFIRDPQAELNKLQLLSTAEIKTKVDALAFAQRVILPDHPESLFVPAFLKEANKAMEDPVPTG
jgi:hypothetical protein